MNLTMNSTIIELSFHICDFVLEVLAREEPRPRVWQKLMSKLQPKIAIFQKVSISNTNTNKYNTIYFLLILLLI